MLRELYKSLVSEQAARASVATESAIFFLESIEELHFLDWHACTLLARVRGLVTLVTSTPVPPHTVARTCATIEERGEVAAAGVKYEPGAVLAQFLSTAGWQIVWHNYLTSRDTPRRMLAGATLPSKYTHLRLGFVTGIDLFHMGEYYAAHEDWESLWMRLDDGPERRAAQGLIMLAGAHIHRLKNRPYQAGKLYLRAQTHLEEAATLDWLDAAALLRASKPLFASIDATEQIAWPSIPPRNNYERITRKHR